jgi:hypothetical protein
MVLVGDHPSNGIHCRREQAAIRTAQRSTCSSSSPFSFTEKRNL